MNRADDNWTRADDLSSDQLRVVAIRDGKPVSGAFVGIGGRWCDSEIGPPGQRQGLTVYARKRKRPIRTDATGIATINAGNLFYPGAPKGQDVSLFIVEPNEGVGALLTVHRERLRSAVTVTLAPLCRVSGNLESRELTRLGGKLNWTNTYVYWGKKRPAACDSTHSRFEMLLPPGSYRLNAYGQDTYNAYKKIRIRHGQRSAKANLDLPAHRLAFLFGKPAPEFRKIKAWKNGAVRLADLRGKVVILEFWGSWCGPCVYSMPALMALHDKFAKQGLVIVAIHDDSVDSLADLDVKCAKARKELWGGRDLPFHVAVDGGGKCKIPRRRGRVRGATTALYGINCFPTTLLIDKQGILVERTFPSDKKWIETRVHELLKT